MHPGILTALLAAALFGASTPFAKLLLGQVAPVSLAGLLYMASGLGLSGWLILRRLLRKDQAAQGDGLQRADFPWLAAAILTGGIAGPVLLLIGLRLTPASTASLLLNTEGVFTALLAWIGFRENVDRRIFIGMLLIVAAGVLLSWEQQPAFGLPWGALAIVAACLCWAVDNNLTRKVSASDPVQIAAIKGLVAGTVNLAFAWALGLSLPSGLAMLSAGVVGLFGYGLSLVLFVVALRHLGTARTGAYFSAAPFVGASLSLLMLGETPTPVFWGAAALMGAGIWLHLTESHGHGHQHQPLSHAHPHSHDEHHQHRHDAAWDGTEPHVHPHDHAPLTHTHAHFPDIHHRHPH